MKYDTAGNKIEEIIICGSCSQDTAGNHEWNCPNRPNKSNIKGICGIVENPVSKETEEAFYKRSVFNPLTPR